MNPEAFQASTSGKLLRVLQGELGYHAFVPHPLPPALDIDWKLAGLLVEATAAVHELAGLGRNLPNPQLFIRPLIRREAVLSSRIEGTQTEIAELYAYEAGQLPLPGLASAPPEADLHEVLNYVKALEYGLERIQTLPVSLRLIRETHAHLMDGVRGGHVTPGEFRTTQNWIGRPGSTLNQATFVPPPVDEMKTALNDLERYFHAEHEYPLLVALALIHYQFEVIHPFGDGNGRIGRLLIALLLVHWGLLPQPLLYLSAYFEKNRAEYVDRMVAVAQRGAWREWIEFFLTGVRDYALDTVKRLRRLQDLREAWSTQIMEKRRSVVALRLVDLLYETPIVTVGQVAERLGVANRTARLNVLDLVGLGILEAASQKGYGQVFRAPEILKIVGDELE
jgi:Fic family protein